MIMNTINFKTWSQAFIFKNEFAGQVSDGKYENTRPLDHWKWVANIDVTVEPNKPSVRTNKGVFTRPVKYSFREWLSACKHPDTYKNGDYAWATRVLCYGTLGKMPLDINQVKKVFDNGNFAYIAEYADGDIEAWKSKCLNAALSEDPVKNQYDKSVNSYYKKRYDDYVKGVAEIGMTVEEFEKMYNANRYTAEDFDRDYNQIMESMNTITY